MKNKVCSLTGRVLFVALCAFVACASYFWSSSSTQSADNRLDLKRAGTAQGKTRDIVRFVSTEDLAQTVGFTVRPSRMNRVVKATAYNALESQTDSTPLICAWGDRIRPGIIAVSRDLESLGLTRGQEVLVEGLGKRVVMDRMHRRKKNQIDIFMDSHENAVNFGVQELVISWEVRPETDKEANS